MADIHAGEHHHPALGHHWESLEQQHEGNVLGMWLFLSTEIMLFGAMFTAYLLFRTLYPSMFEASSHFQNVVLGAINTGVLIGSSLTMALAVRSAQLGEQRAAMLLLVVTALAGALFLGIKGVEYYEHWHEGLVPGLNFTNHELAALLEEGKIRASAQLFFFLYFVMTGLHAIHLLIGIGLVLFLAWRVRQGRYLNAFFEPIEALGLYWHFVDVVWVFLFPLLYLLGRQ